MDGVARVAADEGSRQRARRDGWLVVAGWAGGALGLAFATIPLLGLVAAAGAGLAVLGDTLRSLLVTGGLVALAAGVAVPIGLAWGGWMDAARRRGRAAPIPAIANALDGGPTLAGGLFVALWLDGRLPTELAGVIALAIPMVPAVARVARAAFAEVGEAPRRTALALGATRWDVWARVIVPATQARVSAGLGRVLARAFGQTTPLIVLTNGWSVPPLSVRAFDALRAGHGAEAALHGAVLVGVSLALAGFANLAIRSAGRDLG